MTKRLIAVVAGLAGMGGLLAGPSALGSVGGIAQAGTAADYNRCLYTDQAGPVTTNLAKQAKKPNAQHTVCGVYMLTNL